jgi:hypothetical protein
VGGGYLVVINSGQFVPMWDGSTN